MKRITRVRAILLERQNGKCCYCGRKMFSVHCNRKKTARANGITRGQVTKQLATLEHLKRRCEGGGNNRDNLALACHECNTSRGEMSWLQYKTIKSGEVWNHG